MEATPYVIKEAMERPFKVCTKCGRGHSEESWYALEFVGIQEVPDDASLELRNCSAPCLTTLAVEIKDGAR